MAKSIKAIVKPELLIWARDSAGYNVKSASEKLKIAEEKLTKWEEGKDAPTINQLRKMAQLYKRPLSVFYLQKVPANFQVIKDFRRLPGEGLKNFSPALTLEIRYAYQRRALALELSHDLGQKIKKFDSSASMKESPENLASKVREYLKITFAEQEKQQDRDGRTSFNFWKTKIESLGVLVFQATRIGSEEISGFALAEEALPVIVVNQKDPFTRRTFSLLHEFSHLLLNTSGVSDLNIDGDLTRAPEEQKVEIFCNHVAAASLMPGEFLLNDPLVVKKSKRSTNWLDSEISAIAKRFGVSREALLRRLLFFELTTNEFYRKKRIQFNEEFLSNRQVQKDLAAEQEFKRNVPREVLSAMGRPLVNMVLRNYYQDHLTLGEVTGYLGIRTKHLSKIERYLGYRA